MPNGWLTKPKHCCFLLLWFYRVNRAQSKPNPSSNVCLLSSHLGKDPRQLFSVMQDQDYSMYPKTDGHVALWLKYYVVLKACHLTSTPNSDWFYLTIINLIVLTGMLRVIGTTMQFFFIQVFHNDVPKKYRKLFFYLHHDCQFFFLCV